MFITFEGIEGSGKSTQIDLLLTWLTQQKISFKATLEPGGTNAGQTLRHLLLSTENLIQSNRSELFLFAADRCEHIQQVIRPTLDAGQWVVCDRYVDSTYAYQYGGRQHKKSEILDIIRLTHAIEPDITFLLDLSPEEGLKRAKSRSDLDRFEQEALAFHQRVRDAYLERENENRDRICLIHTDNMSRDAIFDIIKKEIEKRRVII